MKVYGWTVILVAEGDNLPGWGYSIGLYRTFKHPEVITFGLPKELTRDVVNCVGDDVKSGKQYSSGNRYPNLLEGALCIFQVVEKIWYKPFLGQAISFYDGEEFPVLQCIWPDKEQNYPWDWNFNHDWRWAQPLLFHTNPKQANTTALLCSMGMSFDNEPTS